MAGSLTASCTDTSATDTPLRTLRFTPAFPAAWLLLTVNPPATERQASPSSEPVSAVNASLWGWLAGAGLNGRTP